MTTLRDAMANFIADYYYGTVERDIAVMDADAFLEAMLDFPEPVRLELAGKLTPWWTIEIERMAQVGKMLAIHGEEPDEKGQVSFNGALMHSAELACLAIAYPLVELCRHQIDEQAGCCIKCGSDVENLPAPPSEDKP